SPDCWQGATTRPGRAKLSGIFKFRVPEPTRIARAAARRGSMEPRLDLLAHQPQRVQHPGLRDLAAAVQFGEDAVETDLLLDLAQPRREAVRFVDQELRRERFVIGERL